MDRNAACGTTEQPRELTEAELDLACGGFEVSDYGFDVEQVLNVGSGTHGSSPRSIDIFKFVSAFGSK